MCMWTGVHWQATHGLDYSSGPPSQAGQGFAGILTLTAYYPYEASALRVSGMAICLSQGRS